MYVIFYIQILMLKLKNTKEKFQLQSYKNNLCFYIELQKQKSYHFQYLYLHDSRRYLLDFQNSVDLSRL